MNERVKTLVALDSGVDRDTVEASLPEGSDIQVVAFVDGLEESWTTLQETATDLVVVACAGYSERTLVFIDGAVKQRKERPVVVLCDSSPNGFVRRVFEAGADDIITLPESPGNVLFSLEKAVARKQGAVRRDRRRARADDLRARPEGRDRQDADLLQPRGQPGRERPQGRSRRPRSPVRRRRSRARARPGAHDLRSRQVGRLARRREDRRTTSSLTPPGVGS